MLKISRDTRNNNNNSVAIDHYNVHNSFYSILFIVTGHIVINKKKIIIIVETKLYKQGVCVCVCACVKKCEQIRIKIYTYICTVEVGKVNVESTFFLTYD